MMTLAPNLSLTHKNTFTEVILLCDEYFNFSNNVTEIEKPFVYQTRVYF